MPKSDVLPCKLLPEVRERVERYARALEQAASQIGDHGLSEEEFRASGLFRGAIEHLRGRQAASMSEKKRFCSEVLSYLRRLDLIRDWVFAGADERHDYEVRLPSGRTCIIEAKGGLDGNNTTIFERPQNADEFVIWSLNQNPTSDPVHNAWSGLHTRLGADLMHRKQLIEGVVIWDMLCGTAGRPCPRVGPSRARLTKVEGRYLPPPCLFLMPRSVPDPRNNPSPPCRSIREVEFLGVLAEAFGVAHDEIGEVRISAQMSGADVQRRTEIRRGPTSVTSGWTTLKRATR